MVQELYFFDNGNKRLCLKKFKTMHSIKFFFNTVQFPTSQKKVRQSFYHYFELNPKSTTKMSFKSHQCKVKLTIYYNLQIVI